MIGFVWGERLSHWMAHMECVSKFIYKNQVDIVTDYFIFKPHLYIVKGPTLYKSYQCPWTHINTYESQSCFRMIILWETFSDEGFLFSPASPAVPMNFIYPGWPKKYSAKTRNAIRLQDMYTRFTWVHAGHHGLCYLAGFDWFILFRKCESETCH